MTRTAVVVALALALGCDRGGVQDATRARAAPLVVPRAPCPDEMALVALGSGAICVDRYEAAIQGQRHSESPAGIEAGTLRAKPAKGIDPQTNLSAVEAETACEGSAKRLCTAAEWTAACRGPQDFVYPYGNEHVAGACNEGRPSPVSAVFGTMGGRLDDPRLGEVPNGVAPGGSFPRCVSAYGVFDMHGNVQEWVSDSSRADDPRFGMFLGGFFAEASENGAGCLYKTTAHFKSYHDYSIGFRCCTEPRG
jgi:formylglycine-generating enzyme required for sulfatase activity